MYPGCIGLIYLTSLVLYVEVPYGAVGGCRSGGCYCGLTTLSRPQMGCVFLYAPWSTSILVGAVYSDYVHYVNYATSTP